jgi:ABC-2 type transport system ATP-binding protein
MIESRELSKYFGKICAVDQVTASIKKGNTFGLLGTNGAGKSTFLRLAAGIYRADKGSILLEGEQVYENPSAKRKIFYISDEQYFFPNTTAEEQGNFFAAHYPDFDKKTFLRLLATFDLDAKRRVNTYSKGMKKQLSVFCAICANTPYIFCDETFDGLDPVVRQAVKSLFADAIERRQLTPVIASHNLRELEDICDHIGLLHKGGLLLSRELESLKLGVHKIQIVFPEQSDMVDLSALNIISNKSRGRLQTLVIRGEAEEIQKQLQQQNPVYMEILPLTLEEVFITETEVVGYEFTNMGL